MSHGFITLAQNNIHTDYLKLAYGLGLSIKASQSIYNNLSVLVSPGQIVPEKYKLVFDQIIEIPWGDMAFNEKKFENEWKVYHTSPYDHTIKLDADMLFFKDISEWWKTLSIQDVWASTKPITFRGLEIKNSIFRKCFEINKLPDVYSALFYFKKSTLAEELFLVMESIFKDWKVYSQLYFDASNRPKVPATDEVLALAIKLIDGNNECLNNSFEFFKFVHMKTALQDLSSNDEDWTKIVDFYLTPKLDAKIGCYNQKYPLHYHYKEFLTDNIIKTYERFLGI